MYVLNAAAAALAWLGRQGTRAVAASIFLGLALPPLAAVFKPYLTEAIFALLTLAFLRVDLTALRGIAGRPRLILAGTVWIMLVTPALLGGLFLVLGLPERAPGLLPALMLQAAAPPLMATPAFAALLGLDVALTLVLMVIALVLTPFTAPVFADFVLGTSLAISPLALGARLFALLAGAAAVAAAIRWVAGAERIERQRERIDGLNVITLFVFAVALMEGVAARMISSPLLVVGLIALATGLSFGIGALTMLVFIPAGRENALAIGLTAAQRNMGLMLAATGGAVPDVAWLYFALAQFPIYLSPQILKPLATRLTARASEARPRASRR